MSRWYLDTSAALKLLVAEAESEAPAKATTAEQPTLVATMLLETELRRAVQRLTGPTQADASQLLEGVDLTPSVFREAGLLQGPTLRSLDALHLSAGGRVAAGAIVTYDTRLANAAIDVGLLVLAPGRPPQPGA